MKFKALLSIAILFFSSQAFAYEDMVPEYFFQPEEAKTAVEGGVAYADADADNADELIRLRASAIHGLTHNVALRLGTSYNIQDDADGFNNFDFDIIGHNEIVSKLKFYYGVLGSLTPDKNSTTQNFSGAHTFNPYLGVSSYAGDVAYGARFLYRSITSEGDVWGNFNYDATLFVEMNKAESYLAGASLDYIQNSASDSDYANLNLYGRIYMPNFTILPTVFYSYGLDDDATVDAYGVELAARFTF